MQSLFSNYLTNHSEYTECNSIKSKVNSIYCGAPHRSTLRSLFFSCILTIYVYTPNSESIYLQMILNKS